MEHHILFPEQWKTEICSKGENLKITKRYKQGFWFLPAVKVVWTDPGSESYRTPPLDGAVYRGVNVRYR